MEHKITTTGLHCIINSKGRVFVFTEEEYEHLKWWQLVRIKYDF